MTTKLTQAAVAAVSLSVLFSGQPVHAVMNVAPVDVQPVIVQPQSNSSPIVIFDQVGLPASAYVPPAVAPAIAPKVEPIVQITEQMQPAKQMRSAKFTSASSAGNTYTKGQCTWYVKSRRPDLPNGLGNGGQWVANAAARGFATGTTARAGAVGEQPGHVVYVESVSGDMVNISEMNFNGGVGVVHTRTVAASTFKYIY
jgi:surface antigen